MYSYGFCYGDGDVRGYRALGIAKTLRSAQNALSQHLTEPATIFYKESERSKGCFRAYFMNHLGVETRTNYVLFKIEEVWGLVDTANVKKKLVDMGKLDEMKVAARKYAMKTVRFKRTGDNIKVEEGLYLVKLH